MQTPSLHPSNGQSRTRPVGPLLRRLRSLDAPIRVVIVGAGAMGRGLLHQCEVTPGIKCVGLADIDLDKARRCGERTPAGYREVDSVGEMNAAIDDGRLAVCQDGDLLARCEQADVFIESSNAIGPAARFSLTAIEHGLHLVLMNAEIDLIFGPHLMQRAHEQGVVYASCDGDQHGVIKRLVDEVELWGFDLVMAGNVKGYLDRYANPTSIIPEADKRSLDYRMCTAYTDGTKLCIEMAILANALGLDTATPGMYGPRAAHVREVPKLFDLEALRQRERPVVDYVLGAQPGGGVYAVGYCDDPYQQDMLKYYKMGNGPFYVFYRPYHLCHVEAMQGVVEAALDGQSLLEPECGLRTNVYAYAKRDLQKGEALDGIGGYACYGLIENSADHEEGALGDDAPGLPICIAEEVTLTRAIAKDEPIRMSDVDYDPSALEFDLYAKALAAAPTAPALY